ncbi:MAG: cell division protein SepF [Oscillospiraceae bacterium]|nr:cell division protein SepF [Oscillospiraceae bacterium]
MGLMDELKKLTHPYSDRDEDDFDDFDDDTMEEEPAPAPAPTPRRGSYTRSSTGSEPIRGNSTGRVVNINATTQMQVVLVKPDRFDQVSDIADHLRDKRALVLNLESTNKDVARRLVDFLSGCAYALDGKIKKIAISTYLITPYNVDVVGDLVEELESNGMYF